MSGFTSGSHQPAASQSSAPPSALDIVHAQGVNTWESLLSPVAETTSTALPDDSELINSPNFLLGVPTFSSDLEATAAAADSLSWDSALFSASRLRPSALAPSAYQSTFAMMPLDPQNYASYPFGSYPLLPVLSASPYEVSRTSLTAEELSGTVSPASVSLSQVAPPPAEATTPQASVATPSMRQDTPQVKSREASMELDDNDEGDYDDEDMDDEDGGDEYKERSRGARKDARATRPAVGTTSRKADSTGAEGSTSGAKRSKTSKQTDGSESGSTPAPAKRRGGTRIAVADFVPPDVSGLSKREARLVKNRAAAFLSRQRKREEFELMEVRLQEVLEENARLKSGAPAASPSDEVQRLQEALRIAEEREQQLKKELEEQARVAEQARLEAMMKVEEPTMTVQEALKLATPMAQSPRSDISSLDGSALSSNFKEKDSSRHSGPGFNLMVLVFSLTLLGMPHQHQLQASMRNGGAQPTRISFEPSGSSTSSAFPSLFENVLERWEGSNRIQSLEGMDPVDEDDEMEVEVEPWEQEEAEASADQSKKGNSYVVDFEMPVVADQVGTDDEGKIKVRISPCGVPRPRQSTGALKPGELVWDGTPLPPVEASGMNLGSSSSFVADWETWGGWQEFLSDDIVGTNALMTDTLAPTASVDEALTPRSEIEQSTAMGDNASERWSTPPPFPLEESKDEQTKTAPVETDVSLSTLPAWSRALVQAVAGEKLKARIRVTKKAKVAGRSRSSLSLGKKKMGLVVKV